MRICAVMKYPPIEGGVSARCYWIARALAMRGHQVHVVTNAAEVEDAYRMWIPDEDRGLLEGASDGGGCVTVVSSGAQPRALAHVPRGDAYVTRLAGLAAEEIRRRECDVVFSYYYEPYGVSAHLASTWTGVPHVVQHAGSDRGRLMNHPELALAHREMLRHASVAVTADRAFEGLGIPCGRLARAAVSFLPGGLFTPAAEPLDVDALLRRAGRHPFVRSTSPWRDGVPTFGVLGKVGEVKGSYDLVAALARLRARGHDFNLLAMVAGPDRDRFLVALAEAGLAERTWTLPLLPHWRVPGFLRRCTAVCFLERRFPIPAHRPGIPQEILASATCAVLSREIVEKQRFRTRLRHGEHALVVEDPSDTDELAAHLESVVRDPARALAIGAAGAALVDAAGEDELGRTYEELLRQAIDRPRGRPDAGPDVRDVRAFLARHAPATVRLMAREVEDAIDRCRGERASGTALAAHRAVELLAGGASGAVLEVLRLERQPVWLAVDLETPAGIPAFPRPPASSLLAAKPRRGPDGATPVRSDWLRISEHDAGVERAIEAALRGEEEWAAELTGQPALYAFHKRGDLGRRVHRINPAVRELLELCDGSRTVEEVEAALAERGIGAGRHAREAIDRLAREGLLQLR